MTTLPDPNTFDWTGFTGWMTGAAAVIGAIGYAVYRGIHTAMTVLKALPQPPKETTQTSIITADTVAMHELATTIEANNAILTENNLLRREEHADREANRQTVKLNTDTLERAIATINEARSDMRDLKREMVVLAERMKS